MKKLFEVKVRGYYVLSMVAGVLLGLVTAMIANVMLMQAELSAASELRVQSLAGEALQDNYLESADYEHVSQLMPLKGVFDVIINSHATVILALLCIITVVLYAKMIILAKHWRTKFLQSIGWMLLFLFVTETVLVNINLFGLVETYGIGVFIPAILLVIPVLILCKTREMTFKNDSYWIDHVAGLFKANKKEVREYVHQALNGKPFRNVHGEEMNEDEVVAMVCETQGIIRQMMKK